MIDKYREEDNIYIGDIEKDMLAAKDAGVGFIHARYGFQKDVESNVYIDDIKELIEKINL